MDVNVMSEEYFVLFCQRFGELIRDSYSLLRDRVSCRCKLDAGKGERSYRGIRGYEYIFVGFLDEPTILSLFIID